MQLLTNLCGGLTFIQQEQSQGTLELSGSNRLCQQVFQNASLLETQFQ
jgi:hypothetical protein